MDTFMSSDEAFAADALFDAYRRRDAPCILLMDCCSQAPVSSSLSQWTACAAAWLPDLTCGQCAWCWCSCDASVIQTVVKRSAILSNLDNQARV